MQVQLEEASARYDVWYDKLEYAVHCESDHFSMDVITGLRLGKAGEIGAVQLHPRGLLPDFYRTGYSNPRSFRQSVFYLAEMVAKGYRRHWSCWPSWPSRYAR
jgi:hypothetical protein